MPYSETGIVNLAIGRLGSTGRITSLDDTTANAVRAKAVWQYIRDEVLEDFPWKFAKTRAALAKDSTDPAFGFDCRYVLPYDCLKVLSTSEDQPDNPLVYEIESGYLLTDYDNSSQDLYILYTKRVTDTTKYSPSFVNALAYRLAAELAMAITNDKTIAQSMQALYQNALLSAQGTDAQEGSVEEIQSWDDVGREVISTTYRIIS